MNSNDWRKSSAVAKRNSGVNHRITELMAKYKGSGNEGKHRFFVRSNKIMKSCFTISNICERFKTLHQEIEQKHPHDYGLITDILYAWIIWFENCGSDLFTGFIHNVPCVYLNRITMYPMMLAQIRFFCDRDDGYDPMLCLLFLESEHFQRIAMSITTMYDVSEEFSKLAHYSQRNQVVRRKVKYLMKQWLKNLPDAPFEDKKDRINTLRYLFKELLIKMLLSVDNRDGFNAVINVL